MAIDIDGFAVLGAIARKPEVFPAIKNEVSKIARTLVVKQLKEKTLPISRLREIARAVDLETFDLILDLMTDAEIKSMIGKIDRLNAQAKAETPQWHRKRISDLAHGRAEPAAKAVKAKPEPKPAKQAKRPPKLAEPVVRAGDATFSKARPRR